MTAMPSRTIGTAAVARKTEGVMSRLQSVVPRQGGTTPGSIIDAPDRQRPDGPADNQQWIDHG